MPVRQMLIPILLHRAYSVMLGIMRRLRRMCVHTVHLDTMIPTAIQQHRVTEQRMPVLQDHTLSQDQHHVPHVPQAKQT